MRRQGPRRGRSCWLPGAPVWGRKRQQRGGSAEGLSPRASKCFRQPVVLGECQHAGREKGHTPRTVRSALGCQWCFGVVVGGSCLMQVSGGSVWPSVRHLAGCSHVAHHLHERMASTRMDAIDQHAAHGSKTSTRAATAFEACDLIMQVGTLHAASHQPLTCTTTAEAGLLDSMDCAMRSAEVTTAASSASGTL